MPSWQVAASSLKKKTISRRPTRPPRLKAKPMAGRRRQTQTFYWTQVASGNTQILQIEIEPLRINERLVH